MEPGFDDHFQRLIHEQAYARQQALSSMAQMCALLGSFRQGLIESGFSQDGAERLALEFYCATNEAAAHMRDD